MDEILRLAASVATKAHASGPPDKNGDPYIGHPAAVAGALADAHYDDEVVAVGWLHDVVEDTDVTLDQLRAVGFSERVVQAVDAISIRQGEPRDDYYARVVANPVAHTVKWFDVGHNCDPARLSRLDESTRERLIRKYEHAKVKLGGGPP